ncbi:MAG: toxin [Puniceicoccaceae bacterium]|nr:toxin [Puniceicoccaceae bacterium]|tara:strand:+ start:253 stop:525 length:273 start_codon:yes stop_codon:yes gene_type:complete
MEFEYDPIKSELNKAKHGLDFEEAQSLWNDPDCIGFPAKSEDEERFALLAMLNRKLWGAFYTPIYCTGLGGLPILADDRQEDVKKNSFTN